MTSNIKPVKLTDSNKIQVNPDDGFIRVTNYGLFLSYFSVFYRYNGRDYYKESPIFSMFFSETITFPKGATDIDFTVYVQVYFQLWNTIYFKIFKTPPQKCYKLMGISLYSTCTEVPCNGSDINGPNCNCCNCCNCCKCYKCCDNCDYYKLYSNHK
ncbi:hypothetical protein [Clostridium niameyense]|uniref:hypothetical protein n=1 Tax=Clostridium niameyense TaxID=1622073 RepID=UPI00067F599F|nr:hypothetical protein [Clostridium niameyense]